MKIVTSGQIVMPEKEHAGAREMYDFIATWEKCSIVLSNKLLWSRFGILSILGDYVLSHVKGGDILEIGVGESSILLTRLAEKFGKKVYHCDISIGEVTNCLSVSGIFDENGMVCCMPSDQFFKEIGTPSIALGFIDGDHLYDQVKKDFDNLFPLMLDNGFIFLHDGYPPTEEYINEWRCGTVYQLRQELEERKDVDVFTFPFGAMGVGLTMVRKLPKDLPYYREKFRHLS